jgi:L-iditol 2-dehydrogenase
VGEGVEGISVGDTVTAAPLVPCHACRDCQNGNFSLCAHYGFIGSRQQGAFADFVVVPAKNVVKYDSHIPFVEAAMFEPATVGLHGLLLSDYKGGDTVAILGCGTIGLFTLQWAKIFGAKRIVAFDISDARLALARSLGANETVNCATEDMMARVMELTSGEGCSRVFETAGSPATTKNAFLVAGKKAVVTFIGTPHGDVHFSGAEWELLNRKELTLHGSWMSYSAAYPGREWELTAHYLATGELRVDRAMIDKIYPMSEARKAFSLFKERGKVNGKIMLVND